MTGGSWLLPFGCNEAFDVWKKNQGVMHQMRFLSGYCLAGSVSGKVEVMEAC